MKIDVITYNPEMYAALDQSVLLRAQEKGKIEITKHKLGDYAKNRWGKVDDKPYGSEHGQLIECYPVVEALKAVKTPQSKVIVLSPQGKPFNQAMARELAKQEHLVFIGGRFEGFDQRIIDNHVDEEISLGDYVLTNGDMPTMIVIDAITRLIDGVIKEDSFEKESFSHLNLLEQDQYTKPREFEGLKVPEVLYSGDHKKIEAWNFENSLAKTLARRPELIDESKFNEWQMKIWRKLKVKGSNYEKN